MKPLVVLLRVIIVGCFWSVFFLEGIRVVMLRNWYFDIISKEHWLFAWNLWMSGWVISDAKEWAFVLILVTFIPLWLTGWAALSLIEWENIVMKLIIYPINLFRKLFHKQVIGIKKITNSSKQMKRKPSYKEVRPRGTRPMTEEPAAVADDRPTTPTPPTLKKVTPLPQSPKPMLSEPVVKPSSTPVFEHSLLSTDNDDDDFVFNFDAFDVDEKPKEKEEVKESRREEREPKQYKERETKEREPREYKGSKDRDSRDYKPKDRDNNKDTKYSKDRDSNKKPASKPRNEGKTEAYSKPSGSNNIADIIKQKGYEVITGATVKGNSIDFIGVAKDKICLCLLDREPGDWLADEERFNDEEPLWFSESSHRISPVRKTFLAKKHLENVLSGEELKMEVEAYVIIQLGNIINAEDMFEVWNDMNVYVTRIDRGSPKEIVLFAKGLNEAGEAVDAKDLEKLKKIIRK